MGGSYYPIPCSILSTGKDRKTPQQYPDVPTTSWRIFIRSIDSFQGLTPKSPSSWHRPLAPMFPHDTQYCMEDPKQAFVEYASSRTDEAGDFKLTDENHVLLKVPKMDNMYCVDLKNVIPQGGLTCLFAKATPDESNLWHRRLGHV
ncbi:hypothetical protein Tco_0175212 [Tanacetum coccineum]